MDHTAFAILIEEISRYCASTAVIIDVHPSVGMEPILMYGSEAQKRRWLPRPASGEVLGAFALTQPGAGSDAASLQTRAPRVHGGSVPGGAKTFMPNLGPSGTDIAIAHTVWPA